MSNHHPMTATEQAIADTVRWLEHAVIGLNLCPFAKAPHVKGRIHYTVSLATEAADLMHDVQQALQDLQQHSAQQRETTLLIIPNMLADFLDFHAQVEQAQRLLKRMHLLGTFQIAAFHPQFQFAGTDADDITNCTNRSPYPILHLLREDSIAQAVQAFPEAETIYQANMQTLQALGKEGWDRLDVKARS
jgi:hypothetical protein